MNLALSEDQVLVRDSAQGFLADASAPAAVRRAMATPSGVDEALWQRMSGELGWCGTTVPETYGGLGLGPVELVLIVEQMGRRLSCAPFFGTVCLGATLLSEAATQDAAKQYLPEIASGRVRATVAFDTGVSATEAKDGWLLTGTVAHVVDAASADLLVLVAGERIFAVRSGAAGLAVTSRETWDATRRFADLALRKVPAAQIDDPARRQGLPRAQALAHLYLAAEQLGSAQECLDLALRHTSERKQFGRPIASFQAVKHRCAQMMVAVEALRSAVYGAAALAATRPPIADLERECAMVKALASDTAFQCAQEAIQLHGGVGFTWEYEPHLYFKRAQAMSHWLGTAGALREHIAASLLD